MSNLIISDEELDELIGFQIFAKPELVRKIRSQKLESELGIFKKVKPAITEGYADHLSGNWDDVPDWAIARINFLEEQMKWNDEARCPLMEKDCPNVPEMSCHSVKHCYPYLCNGSCGHNEMWVSDNQKGLLNLHPEVF